MKSPENNRGRAMAITTAALLAGCATVPKGAQFEYPGLSNKVRLALIEVLQNAEDGDMECPVLLKSVERAIEKVSEVCGSDILQAVKGKCQQSRKQVDDYCAIEVNRTTCIAIGKEGEDKGKELFRKQGPCPADCTCHEHVPVVKSKEVCRRQKYPEQCLSPGNEIAAATRNAAEMCRTALDSFPQFDNTIYFDGPGFIGTASFDRASLDPSNPDLRSANVNLYSGSSKRPEFYEDPSKSFAEPTPLITARRQCRAAKPAEPPRPPVFR